MIKEIYKSIGIITTLLFLSVELFAQGSGGADAAAVAKELQNPTAPLASLTNIFEFKTYKGTAPGATDVTSMSYQFQPGFPFNVGDKGKLLFVRPLFTFQLNPPFFNTQTGQMDNHSMKFSDISFDIAYGGVNEKKNALLYGIVGNAPTGHKDISSKQWRFGPEFLLAKIRDWGVGGVYVTHQTAISNGNQNLTTLQPIVSLTQKKAISIGYSGIITRDWTHDSWVLPVGFFISKVVVMGKTPWSFQIEPYYNVASKGEFGQTFQLRFTVKPIVKNVFAQMLGQ